VCGVFFVELLYNCWTKTKVVTKKPEALPQVAETVPALTDDDSFKQAKPIN
jgi:hypothetical protein